LKKLSPKKAREARINRAVAGFVIPMMQIPKLFAQLESAIERGLSDDYLKAMVREWPGVKESV
jgi:hypothetical protein